ncbi:MAG: hypothetical protein RR207_04395 [Clostridia bacterium]
MEKAQRIKCNVCDCLHNCQGDECCKLKCITVDHPEGNARETSCKNYKQK